jgi:hypothetical protein
MNSIAKTAADLQSHPLSSENGFDEIVPFLLGVSDFVARHLPGEDVLKKKSATEKAPKLVSDPVVGYVRIMPFEAELLDTPLFQRLRHISQLSFVEQVYPSLGYCRFEHTLGVLGTSVADNKSSGGEYSGRARRRVCKHRKDREGTRAHPTPRGAISRCRPLHI